MCTLYEMRSRVAGNPKRNVPMPRMWHSDRNQGHQRACYPRKSYFNIITTIEDYQVVRMFLMIVEMRKGMKVKPAYLEIGQYFIDTNGNKTIVAIPRTRLLLLIPLHSAHHLKSETTETPICYVSDQ